MKITLEITNAESRDWYGELSLESKKFIEEGLEDIEKGRVSEHDEVMARARAKIKS